MTLRSDGLGAKTEGLKTLAFLFPLAMRPCLNRFRLRCHSRSSTLSTPMRPIALRNPGSAHNLWGGDAIRPS